MPGDAVIDILAIENYRSLRRLVMPLTALNVVTGGNGSGKSSLYRALRLLADSSRNGAVAALARESGLTSTLWAAPERIGRSVREGRHAVQETVRLNPVGLRLGFGADDFSYASVVRLRQDDGTWSAPFPIRPRPGAIMSAPEPLCSALTVRTWLRHCRLSAR